MGRRLYLGGALAVSSFGFWAGWRPLIDTFLGVCDVEAWQREHDYGSESTPVAVPGKHEVTLVESRRVVPSDALPPEASPEAANNNLDVVRHDGRVFLAWRTAPDHFASPDARVVVVSSKDEKTFRFESAFALGRDLREPRFLSYKGSLFLYVTRLGKTRYEFEPEGVSVAELRPDGSWTGLEPIGLDSHVAWRTKVENGKPYMVAYGGADQLYRVFGDPMQVELLTTDDGRRFVPVSGAHPAVTRGGGSEADFTLGDDGRLFAVVRNEAGDDMGWGSKICTAPSDDIADWKCKSDPRKFDSPFVFKHDGEVYLLARRHVTPSGNYDVGWGAGLLRTARNQLEYTNGAKRCALWRLDQSDLRVSFVLDLPSKGDTCFPGMVRGEDGEIVVYDYSSDIEGPEVPWRIGQRRPTFIYRHVLRFQPAAPKDPAG